MTLRLAIVVSAGARRSEVVCRHGDGWKVRVAAPPERGRANQELVHLLAGVLGLAPASIRVASGRVARRKSVEVEGMAAADADRLLAAAATRPA